MSTNFIDHFGDSGTSVIRAEHVKHVAEPVQNLESGKRGLKFPEVVLQEKNSGLATGKREAFVQNAVRFCRQQLRELRQRLAEAEQQALKNPPRPSFSARKSIPNRAPLPSQAHSGFG